MPDLTEGDLAPDFTLPLDDGRTFNLAAERGHPVVLFFYPQDDTGGCTTENKQFSELAPEFSRLGATLIGISPDTLEKHTKFRAKHGLTVPLAADPEHLAIEPFGLWKPKKLYSREFMGLIRTSFIIGADGRVARIIKATRIAGHAEKLLEALAAHVAENPAK
ncbi:peroxiredoxin [Devosia sp. 2618]|uniref:peroxiredoxin n=1 Tax=Devosia sp. 2618 TaxID=3156454 RepID=UPI003392FF47